jgi:Phosphate transporter family
MLIVVLALAYLFEFANGWTDAPNSIATVVSTRVLRPLPAVIMAGTLNLVGALVVGTAVAKTIASGIVDPQHVTLGTVAAAVLAATLWALSAQYFGLPSSESHALVAGLLGAGFAAGGLEALEWSGTEKSLIGLVTSPVGGFLVGLVLMVAIYRIFARVRRPTVSRIFGRGQILSAGFMAFSHGTNDAQKTMGIIALAVLPERDRNARDRGSRAHDRSLDDRLRRARDGRRHDGGRVARDQDDGHASDPPGARERVRRRDGSGDRHHGGGQARHPRVDDPCDRVVDHGCRSHEAAVRRSMGRGGRGRRRMGADVALVHDARLRARRAVRVRERVGLTAFLAATALLVGRGR